ncbi:hypothetical protein SAMN02745123_02939 [Desulforamulus aeronauticus DSM 10349]|uniref:Uncharacterized protein n=2 Tax=Desulforamulus aeronauticus TaxID=53343 RepID=A0A1M6UW01_9FIRM|nr:hypothetical protein SAMN02745123_02939 [Desulforamulus aeronauticus DSM 10349]
MFLSWFIILGGHQNRVDFLMKPCLQSTPSYGLITLEGWSAPTYTLQPTKGEKLIMKKGNIVKALATGVLAAGLITSFSGSALASENSLSVSTAAVDIVASKSIFYSVTNGVANQSTLKEALADLVTSGTITQNQSDAVLEHFQQDLPQKVVIRDTASIDGAKASEPAAVLKITAPADGIKKSEPAIALKIVDPLKDLVDEGTITEGQAQSIRDKMRSLADQQMQQQWHQGLAALVAKGTITEEQSGQILTFLENNNQKMRNVAEKIKDMNPEQRAQHLKENINTKDPISQMVEQGMMTRQQADAVREVVPSIMRTVQLTKQSPQQLQANLNALVGKGTLTEDQAAKILTFLETNQQEMQRMPERIKDMSPEQRTQYLKENFSNRKELVTQMVDQGIIGQQQADAVREAVAGSDHVVIKSESVDGQATAQ